MGGSRSGVSLLVAVVVSGLSACDCGGRTVQTRASIEAEPTVLDFGAVPLGTTTNATVTLRNAGRAMLEVSALAVVDDPESRFFITAESGRSAAAAQSLTVTLSFRASSMVGLASARLRVESNAENAPVLFIPLVGEGVAVDAGSVIDAGTDAGTDAGVDGGGVDAGAGDAGSVVDAGLPDAGEADAGTFDAGVVDAGFVLPTDGGVFRCFARVGAGGQDYGVDVAYDPSGNLLVTGYFESTVVVGGDTLTSLGSRDVFIAKYGSTCQPMWARALGGAAGHDIGEGVAVDQAGNVFSVGYFTGALQIPSAPSLTSAGGADLFVLSFDADGGHRWSFRYGGSGDDFATSVTVSADGGVFVAGHASSSVNFGGGTLPIDGGYDVFVASFNGADGSHRWSRMYGGGRIDQSTDLTCRADGAPTLVGSFSSSDINFGDGALTSNGGSVGFVTTLQSGGTANWSRAFAPTGALAYASAEGVAVNAAGETFVAGAFEGSMTLAGSTFVATAGGYDGFLAKFSSTGAAVWAHQYGGSGPDAVTAVAALSDGSIVATGLFRGTVDFGGGPLTSAGGLDIFVLRLAGDGSHVWSRRFGSTADDHGVELAVDERALKVAVVGKFEGSVDFGSGLVTTTGPAGAGDAFLLLLDL